jgi:lysophospholipase L1-like esterase
MSLFSLFTVAVLAAESIISPLPDSIVPFQRNSSPQPSVTFGTLITKTTISPTPVVTPAPVVLGVQTVQTATPSATPTPQTYQSRKKHYAIAILGDSMVDTLGPEAPHLKGKLTSLFPATTFTILNYGVGATNIDYGIERLTSQYTYLGKTLPPLISQLPDLVIVESFGYNPYSFEDGAIQKHWLALASIVDTLKNRIPGVKIIIAATIAPNSKKFGDGAPGISFAPEDKQRRTNTIKQYLESTVKFAHSQHLPLADVYHASLDKNGDGILSYINGGDHIHYSDAGRVLFAQKVTDAILANRLLE